MQPCGACVNVTHDVLFELSVQPRKVSNKKMWMRVDDALEGSCLKYAMRHGWYPDDIRDVCSDLMEVRR